MTRRPALVLLLAAACGAEEATEAPGPTSTPEACRDAPGTVVAHEGFRHVRIGEEVAYASEPPASGPHWPIWAPWGVHDVALPREVWIHNLEHGGVVFLYRPDAPADAVAALRAAFDALPDDPACGHPRALLTPDPELQAAVAVVAVDHALAGDAVDAGDVAAFVELCRNTAPEDVCADGEWR